LIGNLTKDPELRYTPDGIPVSSLRIAVGRRFKQASDKAEAGDNNQANTADFFTVVVWRRLAEICCEYLKKGKQVAIDGRLQSRSWETSDGQKRSTVEVVAENVQLDRKSTRLNSSHRLTSRMPSSA
jgi:single-strand DNA-binding protein